MSNLFKMSNITIVYYLYGWKLSVYLTLQRVISKPGVLILNYLILKIFDFDIIFDCML